MRRLSILILLAGLFTACGGGGGAHAPTATSAATHATTQTGHISLPVNLDGGAIYAINADGTNPRLLFDDGDGFGASLSPDGRWLGIYAWKAYPQSMSLVLLDMHTRDTLPILHGGAQESIQFGGWSPDGRTFAYLRSAPSDVDSGLFVYDVESRTARRVDVQHPSVAVWSPAGDALFVGRFEGQQFIYRVTFPSLDVREIAQGIFSGYGSFAVSPNGSQLVLSKFEADPGGRGGTAKLTLVQAADGSGQTDRLSVHESSSFGFGGVAWSPDGSRIAYTRLSFGDASAGRGTYVIDAQPSSSPHITRITNVSQGFDTYLEWSFTSAWLLIQRFGCIACDGGGSRVALAAADGSGEVSLPGVEDAFSGMAAWSLDGSRFAYGADRLYSAQIGDPKDAQAIANLPASSYAPIAWTPDSKTFVFIQNVAVPTATYAVQSDSGALDLLRSGEGVLAPDGKTVAGFDDKGMFIQTPDGKTRHPRGPAIDAVQPLAELHSSGLSWSPDAKHLAITLGQHGDKGLAIASLSGDVKLLAAKASVVRWSPDSRRIAYWTDGAVRTVDASGGEPRRVADASQFGFDWSPDGREIAIAEPERTIAANADGSGKTRVLFERSLRQLTAGDLRWSPDGKSIAISNGRELLVGYIPTGSTRQVVQASMLGIDWSADGTRLVFGAQPFQAEFTPGIYTFDVVSGKQTQLTYSAIRRHVVVGRLRDGRVVFQSQFQL